MRESIVRWVGGIILLLLAVAFVFWGINPSITGTSFAAKVNGEAIPLSDFDRELQYQQNQYVQLYHADLTDDLKRALRQNVIERLVRDTALRQHVESLGYAISDALVTDAIRGMAAFQVGGEFSLDLYHARLANEGLSPAAFEAEERKQLELVQLQNSVAESSFYTPAEYRRYIALYQQRRELGYASIPVDNFLDQVTVTDDEIQAHYDANKDSYKSQETVDLEYIELKTSDIAANLTVSDEDLRKYYDDQKDRFVTQEERHASHILIAVGDDDAAAKAKAEAVLARIQGGEDFATVAREVSDDGGTKEAGGDLGWITRGMLSGPFEDALFSMKPGEVKGPVKTDFGYHIIRLEEIRPAQQRTFDEVRDELRTEYKTQHAEDLFYDRANELTDKAFDAYSELASVAADMDLPLQKIEAFPRSGDPSKFENSAPVVEAAFAPEVLEQGANSGLVKLSDDDVLVLRVDAHHPSAVLPLEAVRDTITKELTHARAEERASVATGEFLAAAQAAGPDADFAALATQHGAEWHAKQWVARATPDVPTEVLAAAFRMPKPAAGAVERERVTLANGDGAVLVLSGVQPGDPATVPADQRQQRLQQLSDQAGMVEFAAYAEDVASKATVRVPDDVRNPPVLY